MKTVRTSPAANQATRTSPFVVVLTAVLLLCALFLIVYVPAMSWRQFQLEDTALSLDTSQGRERKQQYEYDEVTAALPETRAELAEVQPLADAAAAKVAELKARRKELRAEKKELEAAVAALEEGGIAAEQDSAAQPEGVSP